LGPTEEIRSRPHIDVIGPRLVPSVVLKGQDYDQSTYDSNKHVDAIKATTANSLSSRRHVVSHEARNPVGLAGQHSTSLSDQHPFTELTNRENCKRADCRDFATQKLQILLAAALHHRRDQICIDNVCAFVTK
jgi:hypothetical protein